jgi:hypothetical protein
LNKAKENVISLKFVTFSIYMKYNNSNFILELILFTNIGIIQLGLLTYTKISAMEKGIFREMFLKESVYPILFS